MSDVVRLTGLRVRGRHGVLAQERREGQLFVVDAELALDLRLAAEFDDLSRTVDYAALATDLAAVVSGEPVALLETLAGRLAQLCLDRPGVLSVTVTVHKPSAPIPVVVDDVSVTVTRP